MPTQVESGIEFDSEWALISHKAARTTTRFATSGDNDLHRSAPGNQMSMKRTSSGKLEGDRKRLRRYRGRGER